MSGFGFFNQMDRGSVWSGMLVAGAVALLAVAQGCQSMGAVAGGAADLGKAAGVITPQQADSIKKSGDAVGKAFEKFTPSQEYYVGRSVGAMVITRYKSLNNEEANRYLNVLGQTLAQFSDKPETYAGYHFLLMESDEINAFAAPGGLIFVSRGMIRCCRDEDDLAAVLAHEIGHVQLEHGIKSIKSSRLTGAVTTVLMETGKSLGSQELAALSEAFEGSINDIAQKMINEGYAHSSEFQADKAAVTIMKRAGYNPNGLVNMLVEMKKNLKPGGKDFAKTHPAPDERIKMIKQAIGTLPVTEPAARQARFDKALAAVVQK